MVEWSCVANCVSVVWIFWQPDRLVKHLERWIFENFENLGHDDLNKYRCLRVSIDGLAMICGSLRSLNVILKYKMIIVC